MAGLGSHAMWLIGALLLGACAGSALPNASGPPLESRLVLPLGADPAASAQTVAERARGAEVVYLGEMHDNPGHHAIQARILETILASGARPALAFEMLAEGQQQVLDDTLATAESPEDADRRLGWRARGWPDFKMYWPLFELARRHRLGAVALDLEPTLVRRITRGGLASLGGTGRGLESRLPPSPARDLAITRRLQAAHCNVLPEAHLPGMVDSWYARNVTIARRLAEAAPRAGQVVVIIGRGHQKDGGVPVQLEALRPGTRQLVVEMVEVASGETAEDAVARRGTGDVVWLTPGLERPDPCAGLRQRLG